LINIPHKVTAVPAATWHMRGGMNNIDDMNNTLQMKMG